MKLNKKEKQLFSFLKKATKEKAPNTTLRVAGGWVRDKLLGLESHDIDIAVDNMSGLEFAQLINNEAKSIKANPEKSKHLETAIVNIFGVSIDFTNLRTETYADSRIPQIKIGTPTEDAKRRDLTINSLFYNINENKIEDFTGGIEDLNNKTARTPLEPTKTFLDDPLRILRTVRFAAKYNLTLEPNLIKAARNQKVKEAFNKKISPERIWSELVGNKEADSYKNGSLTGPNSTLAAKYLKELGYLDIFDPTKEELKEAGLKEEELVSWDAGQNNPHHEFNIWEHTLRVFENVPDYEDYETRVVVNLAALFHDIGKRYKGIHEWKDGYCTFHGHDKVSGLIVGQVFKRLRANNSTIERVKKLIDMHLRPHRLLEEGKNKLYRKYVRNFEDWELSIDLACADSLGKKEYNPQEKQEEIDKYEELRVLIKEAIKDVGTKVVRPISGYDLMEIGFEAGPIMGKVFKAIDEKLLENPKLTKEEALEIANEVKDNFRLSP